MYTQYYSKKTCQNVSLCSGEAMNRKIEARKCAILYHFKATYHPEQNKCTAAPVKSRQTSRGTAPTLKFGTFEEGEKLLDS